MGIQKVFKSLPNTNVQHWGTQCIDVSAKL